MDIFFIFDPFFYSFFMVFFLQHLLEEGFAFFYQQRERKER